MLCVCVNIYIYIYIFTCVCVCVCGVCVCVLVSERSCTTHWVFLNYEVLDSPGCAVVNAELRASCSTLNRSWQQLSSTSEEGHPQMGVFCKISCTTISTRIRVLLSTMFWLRLLQLATQFD